MKRKICLVLALLVLGVAIFVNKFEIKDQGSNLEVGIHQNPIDKQISLNSNRKITQNAVIANQKFKNITFESTSQNKKSLFQHQLANVYRTVTSIRAPFTKNREYGTWLWTPTLQIKPDYAKSVLMSAKENGVNVIYISIDSYLDIYTMKDGVAKENKYREFTGILENFIKEANNMGIAVDAEAGWQNWAEAGHTYKPIAIIDFVKKFNQSHQSGFRGLQYDIEPYLLDKYKEDEVLVLKNFVNLVDKTVALLESSNLKLSIVIPDFYDEKDAVTPSFAYAGETDYAFKHLLNILEKRSGSAIILMSYRNKALGDDGSVEISMNEIQTIDDGFYNTKIIVAQETGEVLPPYITFHKESKKDLQTQVSLIENIFKIYPNFGGIAYHYINSLAALK